MQTQKKTEIDHEKQFNFNIDKLTADQLYRNCKVENFHFQTTNELEPLEQKMIDQLREADFWIAQNGKKILIMLR